MRELSNFIDRARHARGGETMIRVAYSRWRPGCDSGTDGHSVRRGEVIADLGLETDAGKDFTNDEMQLIARAAKFAAIDCIRARNGARIKRRKETMPRAMRELLRDVVLASFANHGVANDNAERAARLLGTTPDAIVAARRGAKR